MLFLKVYDFLLLQRWLEGQGGVLFPVGLEVMHYLTTSNVS